MQYTERDGVVLRIKDLVLIHHKTDREISSILNLRISHVCRIRKQILHISLFDKKKECAKCHGIKTFNCFDRQSKHPDWCIICRRQAGEDAYTRKKQINKQNNHSKYIIEKCLRCDVLFESQILGDNNQHYHTCPRCRRAIVALERVSI